MKLITKSEQAVARLNSLLPLSERKNNLDASVRRIYMRLIQQLAYQGSVQQDMDAEVLNELVQLDLVTCDPQTGNIDGAYPFTHRNTPHRLIYNEVDIHAMCAVDALAVAAVFSFRVKILSQCALSQENIIIIQNGVRVEKASPSLDIHVGVSWQSPGSCAAENLCVDMVFLQNRETAVQWQSRFTDSDIFTLDEAIDFARDYFEPLLK